MSEVKLPTAGRIVHFFPNGTTDIDLARVARSNTSLNTDVECAPAIVTQGSDNQSNPTAHLTIFPIGQIPVFGHAINHKSQIELLEDGKTLTTGTPYWDYPVIK